MSAPEPPQVMSAASSSRRGHLSVDTALRVAIVAAVLLMVMAILDVLGGDGTRAWIRIVSLVVIAIAVGLAMRQRADAGRLLEIERERDNVARAAAAKYSGILAIAADAIIVIDASHHIIHFNHGAEAIFGYSDTETVGQPLSMLIPERVRAVHEHHIGDFDSSDDSARRMGHRRAVSGLRKDGTEFPAEAAISKLDVPGESRIYTVVLRDITESKRIEEAERFLAHTSSRLTQSLDPYSVAEAIRSAAVPTLADACLIDLMDDKGVVVRTAHATDPRTLSTLLTLAEEYPVDQGSNASFGRALRGENVESASSMNDEWVSVHGGDTEEQLHWKQLKMSSMLSVPLRVGERVIGALTLLDSGNGVNRFDSDSRNIIGEFARSAAMALENARLYAAARRATNARDEVLSIVSHDLRNPIGAIAMCARILRDEPPVDDNERSRMLGAISEATGWMQRLIRDLLDVTSIEAGHLAIEKQPVSMASIVTTATRMLRQAVEGRSIVLDVDVPESLPRVMADDRRIEQVVANLLGNAVKFSESGSRVTIRATLGKEGVVTAVQDSGIGIDPEVQPQIFNRFWQPRSSLGRGHGLGLAIAHGIVDAHGGRIWVDSVPDRGSTFSFVLPIAEAHADLPASASALG